MYVFMTITNKGLLESSVTVGTALLNMYMKDGLLVETLNVFKRLPLPNIVSWTTLISRYATWHLFVSWKYVEVFELIDHVSARFVVSWNALLTGYIEFHNCGKVSYCYKKCNMLVSLHQSLLIVVVLRSCGTEWSISYGQEVHMEVVKKGLKKTILQEASWLISMLNVVA